MQHFQHLKPQSCEKTKSELPEKILHVFNLTVSWLLIYCKLRVAKHSKRNEMLWKTSAYNSLHTMSGNRFFTNTGTLRNQQSVACFQQNQQCWRYFGQIL